MPTPPPLYLPPKILEAAQRSGIQKILVMLDPPPQDKALRVEFLENGYATWKPYGEFPLEGIEVLCQDWVKALRKHQFSRKNWHVEILYQINLQTATVLQWPAFQKKRKNLTLTGEKDAD